MKKRIFTCFTGILLTWTLTSVSYSQTLNSITNPGSLQEEFISSPIEINAPNNQAVIGPDEVNVKAIKNFTRSYKNVSDAKWYRLNNGFVVYFTNEAGKTKVVYNKKGNLKWMIRTYSEDKLPAEIRQLVKSTYYDFSVFHVSEVSVGGTTAYLVKMESKTFWKTIKVIDGEMEVVEEYVKS